MRGGGAVDLPGVEDAAVVMGTRANREILTGAGLLTSEVAATKPDDLVIVVKAADEAAGQAALAQAQEILAAPGRTETTAVRPKSLAAALQAASDANLVVISVAGRYAAQEAHAARRRPPRPALLRQRAAGRRNQPETACREQGPLCMGRRRHGDHQRGQAGFAIAVPRGQVGLVSVG